MGFVLENAHNFLSHFSRRNTIIASCFPIFTSLCHLVHGQAIVMYDDDDDKREHSSFLIDICTVLMATVKELTIQVLSCLKL